MHTIYTIYDNCIYVQYNFLKVYKVRAYCLPNLFIKRVQNVLCVCTGDENKFLDSSRNHHHRRDCLALDGLYIIIIII